jgi:hypothetical protein
MLSTSLIIVIDPYQSWLSLVGLLSQTACLLRLLISGKMGSSFVAEQRLSYNSDRLLFMWAVLTTLFGLGLFYNYHL